MKHKVKIAISNGEKNTQVLTSGTIRLPLRILRWLFGDFCEILVLKPSKTVQGIEIQEVLEDNEVSS